MTSRLLSRPLDAARNFSVGRAIGLQQKKRYVITEACYHAAYLMEQVADLFQEEGNAQYALIIRQKKPLDAARLTSIHEKLCVKKKYTDAEIAVLRDAYGGLSQSELALIDMYGVPRFHTLSFPAIYVQKNLNDPILQVALTEESRQTQLSAAIFLDCILAPWWLNTFENRIVNVHSAILPYALGMYAIEQVAANGDMQAFIRAAGASIHYIDEGVDTGPLIAHLPLKTPCGYDSIWQVKADSYMSAFSLLNHYIRKKDAFTHTDILTHTHMLGKEYKARDFSDSVKLRAEENYQIYRQHANSSMLSPSDSGSLKF